VIDTADLEADPSLHLGIGTRRRPPSSLRVPRSAVNNGPASLRTRRLWTTPPIDPREGAIEGLSACVACRPSPCFSSFYSASFGLVMLLAWAPGAALRRRDPGTFRTSKPDTTKRRHVQRRIAGQAHESQERALSRVHETVLGRGAHQPHRQRTRCDWKAV